MFPKLWENKNKNTKGYSPVCKNEWDRQYCRKPNIKCADCDNQAFETMDSKVVQNHLLGQVTIGTYAIRQDDGCIFLAADFDKSSWKEDVLAYKKAAHELGIDVLIEISRSGNGGHAWIFFSENIFAKEARQLGSILLSKASSNHHTLSLDSYDRFFPNQDFLPSGGFGNLIALPLQKSSREEGKTVFVDNEFRIYKNQWKYLSNVRRLSKHDVLQIVDSVLDRMPEEIPEYSKEVDVHIAEKILKSDLTESPEINETVKVFLDNLIFVDTLNISSKNIQALKKIATFANPKYFEVQKMRFSTWKTPKYICCAQIDNNLLSLPRGLFGDVCSYLNSCKANIVFTDQREDIPETEIEFSGKLHGYQKDAIAEINQHEHSVLVAPTGTGKTIMACFLIAKRKKSTLILVHRAELVDQWIEKITSFLKNIEKKNIGVLGGGRKKLKGMIDIAMLQTLSKKEDLNEIGKSYDFVIHLLFFRLKK